MGLQQMRVHIYMWEEGVVVSSIGGRHGHGHIVLGLSWVGQLLISWTTTAPAVVPGSLLMTWWRWSGPGRSSLPLLLVSPANKLLQLVSPDTSEVGQLPLLMVMLQELVKVFAAREEPVRHLLSLLLNLLVCRLQEREQSVRADVP